MKFTKEKFEQLMRGGDYVEGKKYRLVPSGSSWMRPATAGGLAIFRGDHFQRYPDVERGRMTLYPFVPGYEFTVYEVPDEPTWQPPAPNLLGAEWAAQTVDTLAQVGIPSEDIPNALRLVARLQERGVDNAAEVAGIAHVWLVASRG